MSVIVAVPIQYASIKVHVDKGRHWSIVEHVLLHAISEKPRSARELATSGGLPLRLVIESLINLMRAGWADLRADGDHMVFTATAGRANNAKLDKLPPVTRPLARVTKFAVEQVTGSVLRWREISFAPPNSPRLEYPGLVRLPASSYLAARNQAEIVAALLDDDERFRGADTGSARPGLGFALVTVSGKKLEGLPRNPPPELVDRVRAAAKIAVGEAKADGASSGTSTPREAYESPARSFAFSASDLVLGGPEHRRARDNLVAKAKSLVVIHSTFMGIDAIDALFPSLVDAARERGVKVHLFHGKDDRFGTASPTAVALAHLKRRIREERLTTLVHAHSFSTRSHAKVMIADDGEDGFVGLVGSCNWLSSGFNMFEASMRVADGHLLADLASALSQMAFEATGQDGGISLDLAGVSFNLRGSAPTRGRGTARVLLGPEHGFVVEEARDKAKARILIGSHRRGSSAETLSLIPARAAIKANEVEAFAYYSEDDRAEAIAPLDAPSTGEVTMVELDGMHAKFLAWDDDDLVLTSYNLLSADPLSPWAEIGVHVNAPGVAKRFADYFKEYFNG